MLFPDVIPPAAEEETRANEALEEVDSGQTLAEERESLNDLDELDEMGDVEADEDGVGEGEVTTHEADLEHRLRAFQDRKGKMAFQALFRRMAS
jgi:hypothetical protein